MLHYLDARQLAIFEQRVPNTTFPFFRPSLQAAPRDISCKSLVAAIMVARNPLFAVRWTRKFLRFTVLDDIWPEILFFTTVATVVCVVSDKTEHDLGMSSTLLTVLGNVIVLQTVLSFRTSSAIERYHEGRALWASLTNTAKNLSQTIWVHIPNIRGMNDKGENNEIKGILEKKSIINLIQALVVSIKHFVRDEKGIDYEDLFPLVCWLPAFSNFTPDHPYWYKLDFHSSSTTLLAESTPPRLTAHRSRPSISRRKRSASHSGEDSTTDVESDLEVLRDPGPRRTSSPRSNNSDTSPAARSPTVNEPGSSNSILDHERCPSPGPTLLGSTSDSDNLSHQFFRFPPQQKSGPSECNYQPINRDQSYFSDIDFGSDEESKPAKTIPAPGTRRVRFHSRTLVNPKASSSILKEMFPSPSSSAESLQTHFHANPKDEDPEACRKHPDPDQTTYHQTLPHVEGPEHLKPAANPPPERIRDVFPLWRFMAFIGRSIRRLATRDFEEKVSTKRRKRNPYITVESSVPLQISLVLSGYLSYLYDKELMPAPAIESSISNYILSLQDITAQLERLTNTPLPFTYQVHVRMCIWLYLLFLPFQLYDQFGYLTIPAVAFFTFMLVGFMEIGEEIENPFDYDHNDLNLDDFCLQLQRELHEITAQIHSEPSSVLYSSKNYPLAPVDWRTADVLIAEDAYAGGYISHDPSNPSLQRTLLHCWREIDAVTRR